MTGKRKKREEYDAVVIGSGFGGSINALRLAQAGKASPCSSGGGAGRPASFRATPRT